MPHRPTTTATAPRPGRAAMAELTDLLRTCSYDVTRLPPEQRNRAFTLANNLRIRLPMAPGVAPAEPHDTAAAAPWNMNADAGRHRRQTQGSGWHGDGRRA